LRDLLLSLPNVVDDQVRLNTLESRSPLRYRRIGQGSRRCGNLCNQFLLACKNAIDRLTRLGDLLLCFCDCTLMFPFYALGGISFGSNLTLERIINTRHGITDGVGDADTTTHGAE